MLPLVSSEIDKREDFGELCNKKSLTGIAVEIGVDKGEFSEAFLSKWNDGLFYGVDPWDEKHNYGLFVGEERELDYLEAKKRLSKFDNCRLLRMTSLTAAMNIINSIDFVYIDGNHHYDEVVKDLYLWYEKVKTGGIIAGHDYNGDWMDHVRTAVTEFAYIKNLQIYYVLGDAASWYFYKDGEK